MKIHRKPLAVAISSAILIAASTAHAEDVLEEVIVTAQKREAAASDVGIAITAFSGYTLQELGVKQPLDLAPYTPGMTINNTIGDSQPAVMIRGVGINDFNTNTNPGVAVYVDEVYQSIGAMLTFGMYDIDRVEVLKGPQGTLYGRNTTGGAVSIYTKKPTEELDGYLMGDFGNFKRARFEGAVGSAITDNVRYRVSGFVDRQNEGFQTDVFTGKDHGEKDRWGVRGQLEVDFSENINALLRYTHGRDKSDSQIPRIAEGLATLQYYYYTFYDGQQSDLGHYDVLKGDQDAYLDITQDSVSLALNADMGPATLTSITAYDKVDHRNVVPAVGTELRIQNFDLSGNLKNFSEELRLTSNEGELVDWIVGLYYSDNKQNNTTINDVTDGIGVFPLYYYGLTDLSEAIYGDTRLDQSLKTTAVFAHTEWHLSEHFKLTAGLRYTHDKLDYDVAMKVPGACNASLCEVLDTYYGLTDYDSAFNTYINYSEFLTWYYGTQEDPQPIPRSNGITAANGQKVSDGDVTWRLALDWTPNDDTLVYGSVSTGYKSMGFHGGIVLFDGGFAPYKPENLTAYELGAKLTLLDGAMQLNGAVFNYDYKDLQANASLDPGIGLPNDVQTNYAKAKIKGAELELTWVPVEGLTTRFGASWLDTKLTDTTISSPIPVFPGLEPVQGGALGYAPEFTFFGLARYDWSLSNDWGIYAQVDGNYTDEQLTYPGRPDTVLGSYTLYNARLGFTDPTGRWEVAIYGRNLGDEEYNTYAYSPNDGTYSPYGPVYMNHIGAPRTYGLNLIYKFF